MAKAVVDAALKKELDHEEMHSKVQYIVAHGISTTIEGKTAVIGSYHSYLKMKIVRFQQEKKRN